MLPTIDIPIPPYHLVTYSLILALYFGVAAVTTLVCARKTGIPSSVVAGAFAVTTPVAIVGARVLDMLEYAERYTSAAAIFGRRGSSIYGAFFAAFVVAYVYTQRRGVSFLALLDAGAPALALGEAMSRIGCFLNGCCYGVPWDGPLAVSFPRESFAYQDQVTQGLITLNASRSLPVHPVQVYSSLIMFGLAALLARMLLRDHRRGAVFFAFLVSYGALRLGVAPFRTEVLMSMKVFSVCFIVAGSLGLWTRRERVAVLVPSRAAGR